MLLLVISGDIPLRASLPPIATITPSNLSSKTQSNLALKPDEVSPDTPPFKKNI